MSGFIVSDPSSPDFNPHFQAITMFYPDGSNASIPLQYFNMVKMDSLQWSIMFASQIGACGILLIVLAILTSPKKRKTLIFAINIMALILTIARAALSLRYYLGPFFDIYTIMSGDARDVPYWARYTTVAQTASGLALQIFIHLSLILQLRVVYASTPKLNMIVTLVSSAIALTSVAFFFIVTVESAQKVISLELYLGGWIYATSKGIFALSICFYSMVFVIKLGYAIRRRRVLGLQTFGPLQIIFTVGCQTMVIPAVFSVLDVKQISGLNIDGFAQLTPALTAILLPLSSMWAAAKVDTPLPATASGLGSHKRVFMKKCEIEEENSKSYGSASATTPRPKHPRIHEREIDDLESTDDCIQTYPNTSLGSH